MVMKPEYAMDTVKAMLSTRVSSSDALSAGMHHTTIAVEMNGKSQITLQKFLLMEGESNVAENE